MILLPPSNLVAGALLGILTVLAPPSQTTTMMSFEFGNGSVKLENPMKFQDLTLSSPRFLGSGGGGAVFAYSKEFGDGDVVAKVSWLRSAESVRNECKVLQVLEQKHVTGVERCLGVMKYTDDPRRVVIVMEPVMEDSAVSSVSDITPELQGKTVDGLMRTMVQMLAANVVTTDVQPLISQRTGEVILIDMTEARVMTERLSFIDVALVASFCTEIISLIPESLLDSASASLLSELACLEEENIRLSEDMLQVLRSQTFLSQETLDYLDMKLH